MAISRSDYQNIEKEDYDQLIANFEKCDIDKDGQIDVQDLFRACKTESGKKFSYEDLLKAVRELNPNQKMESICLEDFMKISSQLRKPQHRADFTGTPTVSSQLQSGRITRVTGATTSTTHSIDEDEKIEFTSHINAALGKDSMLKDRLPFSVSDASLFEGCRDGLVLSKLINAAVPDTIDERVLNKAPMNPFQMTENNNVVINSAKAIGCSVVNIGSQDLIEGREHLVLGLVWQIIKIGLFSKISLVHHPELFRLLQENETLQDLLALTPDAILIRWVNYHMKEASHPRRISNFSADIKDSEIYTIILNQLCPNLCNLGPLKIQDLTSRAEALLLNAEAIDCRKYVTAKSIVSGNPKLNVAFIAHLFNKHPGLAPLEAAAQAELDDKLFGSIGDREARAFALWMNSLGVEPFVNNLFTDLRDGRVLLQVIDKIQPNLVEQGKINKKEELSRFKAIENTNYIVNLAKRMNFSLVGVQGADITDGHAILTLGLVWQLMRHHVTQTLTSIKKGHSIKDAELIDWANTKVLACPSKSTILKDGESMSIVSFKDSSLKSGRFLLALLESLKPGTVQKFLVAFGDDLELDYKQNAKYAISIARMMGATLFLLPEDILEAKPKMILTFIGALMAMDVSK